jgi:hypothetical protein
MKNIDKDRLKAICKVGQGKDCCRYVTCGGDGFECAKNSGISNILDERVKTGTMHAQGDNCGGLT